MPKPLICDVCNTSLAIGVASCHAPVSIAFCFDCASRGADPEWLFKFWKEDEGLSPGEVNEYLVTFKDGKYLSYKEWYNA